MPTAIVQDRGKTDLSSFHNGWYKPGRGLLVRALWFVVNALLFQSRVLPFSGLKVRVLRLFGASVGVGVVLKPAINIKYPWRLRIGSHTWVGENVWLDNLDQITIGSHCCISQGAFLLCGSHDYTSTSFGLITQPIVLEDGAWVGAKAIVCPGVTMGSHSVLAAGSTATDSLAAYAIYQGNPATKKRERKLGDVSIGAAAVSNPTTPHSVGDYI